MNSERTIILIQGPTGIGKTSLSIKLANHLNTEIISCDSRQFYKELRIGSAPPSKEELLKIKHHFIQNISVKDSYNISKFEIDANKKINELFKYHDKIIVVGGSGLYADALFNGIDEIPETSEKTRLEIQNLYNDKGIEYLKDDLYKKDETYFNYVDLKNPRRIMRALEVIYETNKTYSSFRNNTPKKRDYKIIKIGLDIDRNRLYKRINDRVDVMIKSGLIEEVRSLIKYKNTNALKTIGYNEIFNYIEGDLRLDHAIEEIKKNSRRFAKRQITWLRRDNEIKYFDPEDLNEIIKFIE